MARFDESGPYRIRKVDGARIVEIWPAVFPAQVPLTLGDAVHNMRTALDLMASDMARLRGKNPKNVYFPFAINALNLRREMQSCSFFSCGDDAMNLLEKIAPYPNGNDALRGLHDLDIMDKHQLILPVIHGMCIKGLRLAGPTGTLFTDIDTPYASLHVSAESERDELTVQSISTTAVFGPGTPAIFEGKPVVETLHGLLKDVHGVVKAFRALGWGDFPEESAFSPVGNKSGVLSAQRLVVPPGFAGNLSF